MKCNWNKQRRAAQHERGHQVYRHVLMVQS
jgi:hypothetical protein